MVVGVAATIAVAQLLAAPVAAPTAEQLDVFTVVASFGRATHGLVELSRREDIASLLRRH